LALFAVCFFVSLAAAAQPAGDVAVVEAPGGGQPVAAKCDSQGVIHLLLNSPGGPQYVKSTDYGKTFTPPIAVVDRQSRQPGLEFTGWDLAVGKGGSIHVALGTNAWKLKLPKEEWAFFYARLDAGEASFAPLQNLNRTPSEGFSLAADERGNVTACWLSGKLYANVSSDGGRSFAAAVEMDPNCNPCDCCTTSAAYAADGRLAVLYREETGNERDMHLILWDQKQNKSSRTRISSTLWKINACPMTYYSVVPSGNGFLAAWPTEGRVYFARLDSRGNVISPGEIKTPGMAGMRSGLLALTEASGNTLVAWKKSGQLSWQIYDQTGQALSRLESAKSAGSGVAGVVGPNGRFVLFR
jgi:hypothetical protein